MPWKIVFLLLGVSITHSVKATSITPEQLHRLEAQIQALETQMHNTRTEYGRLQNLLKNSEENIGEVAQRLEHLHGDLSEKKMLLTELQSKKKRHANN
ncbi:MAG: hypothetical protein SVR94_05330 [Pseudomonadota bacterium]|nr:hypothetical protein [Pseudomonadota bacterium]